MSFIVTSRIIMLMFVLVMIALLINVYYYWFSDVSSIVIESLLVGSITDVINNSVKGVYIETSEVYIEYNRLLDVAIFINRSNPLDQNPSSTYIYIGKLNASSLVFSFIGGSNIGEYNISQQNFMVEIDDNIYRITPLMDVNLVDELVYSVTNNVVGSNNQVSQVESLVYENMLYVNYYKFNNLYFNDMRVDYIIVYDGSYDLYFKTYINNENLPNIWYVFDMYFSVDDVKSSVYSLYISINGKNYTIIDDIFSSIRGISDLDKYYNVNMKFKIMFNRYLIDVYMYGG